MWTQNLLLSESSPLWALTACAARCRADRDQFQQAVAVYKFYGHPIRELFRFMREGTGRDDYARLHMLCGNDSEQFPYNLDPNRPNPPLLTLHQIRFAVRLCDP